MTEKISNQIRMIQGMYMTAMAVSLLVNYVSNLALCCQPSGMTFLSIS